MHCQYNLGLYMLNLLCHNAALKKSILSRLHDTWQHIYSNKMSKHFNEIVFCCDEPKESQLRRDPFTDKNENYNVALKSGNSILIFEEISNHLSELKLTT